MENNFFTIYTTPNIYQDDSSIGFDIPDLIDGIPDYTKYQLPWWQKYQRETQANPIKQPTETRQPQTQQPEEQQKDKLSTLEQLKSKQHSILDYIYNKLISKGYSHQAAAGIVGNISQESGGRIDVKGDFKEKNNPSTFTSYGLAQWHDTSKGKGRMTNLFKFSGTTAPTLDQQIEFLDHEIKNNYKDLYDRLNNSTNAESAAEIFCRIFEVPSEAAFRTSIGKRKKSAKDMFNKNVG